MTASLIRLALARKKRFSYLLPLCFILLDETQNRYADERACHSNRRSWVGRPRRSFRARPISGREGPQDSPAALDPAALDAHGFDPDDYLWVPVRRQRRPDGWSNEKQRTFIGALADTGSVTESARIVGMSVTSCYRLRRAPDAGNFAAAWDAAIQQASKRLVDIAFDRAVNGVEHFVIDKTGRHIYTHNRYNDRLLMFLLRAHRPDRYRHAHRDGRLAAEAPPSACAPVADAIAMLEPVTPPAPHLLMAPDDLEVELEIADMMEGELPRWYRDPPVGEAPDPAPLGEEFERALNAAKREAAGLPENEGEDEDECEYADETDETL